jgi:PhnB protein
MLIPYLHFDGDCMEAIELYEKAFNTKANADSIDYMSDGKKIAHAAMNINGTEVYLNDALVYINDTFGNKEKSLCFGSAHLTVTFKTVEELLACYKILKNENDINKFNETPYSKLCGNFVDKFGVLWGFMVNA